MRLATPSLQVTIGLVAVVCATACSAPQRNPDDPLLESPTREQVRGAVTVPWQTLLGRGVQFAQQGDHTRAEQYIAAAIERGAPPAEALPVLLRVCVAAQRYRAASEYARPYLARTPDAWALRYFVATIHIGLNEPQTARRHLELVVRHNPRHADAHFLLGQLLRDDLNDPDGARAHFRAYLSLEPEGPHAADARDAAPATTALPATEQPATLQAAP